MAAKALDDYMHNLERGYSCGYLNIGKDPAAGAYPERRPPWQCKAIPLQGQVFVDRQASIGYARLLLSKLKPIEPDDAEIIK